MSNIYRVTFAGGVPAGRPCRTHESLVTLVNASLQRSRLVFVRDLMHPHLVATLRRDHNRLVDVRAHILDRVIEPTDPLYPEWLTKLVDILSNFFEVTTT